VVTDGAGDIRAYVDGDQIIRPSIPTTAVDVVGAGDAFVAGVLGAKLAGATWTDAIDQGAYCGARVVSALGDWTNLPWGEGGLTAIPHTSEEVAR
jgi:sugar/nucleoside kinase (ribokinase family)